MARLIELAPRNALAHPLRVRVGDVISCAGTGGRVHDPNVLEQLGPFMTGVATPNGVLSPQSLPSRILFVARRPGHTSIDIFSGDLARPRQTFNFEVEVER
jgi:hypothetical protein